MTEMHYQASPEFESFIKNHTNDERLECLDPLDILLLLEEMEEQDLHHL